MDFITEALNDEFTDTTKTMDICMVYDALETARSFDAFPSSEFDHLASVILAEVIDALTSERFDALLAVVSNIGAPWSARCSALSFIVNAAESDEELPPAVSQTLLAVFLEIFARPVGSLDGMQWSNTLKGEQASAAELCVRYSRAVEGCFGPVMNVAVTEAINAWEKSTWSEKVAIFIAISITFEGCHSSTHLAPILQLRKLGIEDTHPQVKAHALGSLAACSEYIPAPESCAAVQQVFFALLCLLEFAEEKPPHPMLLTSALESTNKCLGSTQGVKRFLADPLTPTKMLFKKLTAVLRDGRLLDKRTTAKAFDVLGSIMLKHGKRMQDILPGFLEIAMPLLDTVPNAETADDHRAVIESALQSVTFLARGLGPAAFGDHLERTCDFLCRGLEQTARDAPFMIALARGWQSMTLCLGRDIAKWVPRFVPGIVAGASSPTTTVKEQCFATIAGLAKTVPLSVLGRELVCQSIAAACVDFENVTEADGHSAVLIEVVVCAQRKEGTDTASYFTTDDVVSMWTALQAQDDDDLRLIQHRVFASVLSTVHDTLPLDVSTKMIAEIATSVEAFMSTADDDDVEPDEFDMVLMFVAWTLGYILDATKHSARDTDASFYESFFGFEKFFADRPHSLYALYAGYIANGSCSVVTEKAAAFVQLVQQVIPAATLGEMEVMETTLFQLCTALLELTARAEGFVLEREFVMSIIQLCQAFLCSDEEQEGDVVRSAIRTAVAAAEWLKRNNAPEAAGTAVAMCVSKSGTLDTVFGAVDPLFVSDALEATVIADKFAFWAADPELSAVFLAFPVCRDDILETLRRTSVLSPAGAAALDEASSVEMPEQVTMPTKKRQR